MSWKKLAQHLIKEEDLYELTNDPPEQIKELVKQFDVYWEGKKDFKTGFTLGIIISQMLEKNE